MNENNIAANLIHLLQALNSLQQSLISSAYSLDSIATHLENHHIDSHEPEVVEAQKIADSWIARMRLKPT